jgi:hypothetical protein
MFDFDRFSEARFCAEQGNRKQEQAANSGHTP